MHLRKTGTPHRVLEKASSLGGLASTTEEAGYRFDHTGHLLHLRDPALRKLALDLLEPPAWLEIDRNAVVYSHGVVTKYPFQANVHGLPSEVAYACVRDFVRAHYDTSPHRVDNFEEYCLRHFGETISRAFMIPYNEKLWGVHPRDVSPAWCDRFVPRPSLDDVLRGAFGVKAPELGYNARFLYPRLGMGELVRAMAERATPVDRGIDIVSIDWRTGRVCTRDEEIRYRHLISSLPLTRLVDLLADPPNEIREARKRLRATALQYLDVALNTPCERPWHWVYVPEPRFCFYRVGSYSNFSAALAPPGKGSLYVELSIRDEVDVKTLLPTIADDLVEMGFIRAPEAIRFARLRRIDPAYVIYDHDRQRALDTILPFLRENRIASVGRYGAWEYASMEDALLAGIRAAEETS
ncbi:MAG: hypothetical protein HOW73_08695 [Polyangiaceae bacterium]|nr:hypothetical protein [Polyangiaceae bacterium]